jgi:hypothetical protein
MKVLGNLTSPETRTGRAFKGFERFTTRAAGGLATNDFYLNFAGKQLERTFLLQATWNAWLEKVLRMWRMPTSSDLTELRNEVRRMHDHLEAMGIQSEFLLERLERLQQETFNRLNDLAELEKDANGAQNRQARNELQPPLQ